MKVILASRAGFCMGVRKAMDKVVGLPFDRDEAVYTDGPIIHNSQVIDILEKRNIRRLDEEIDLKNKRVIIRTHGVTPNRKEELSCRGADLLDVTCPRVIRIQKIIERESAGGRTIIIFGDKEHSEVKGLLGYASGAAYALSDSSELKSVQKTDKVSLVSQSTKNREDYNAFAEAVRKTHKDVSVFDTLCDTTARRQDEAVEISREVDAMVVVGGKHSANTRTLAKIAGLSGKPVFHIETEKELNTEDFKSFNSVGLTAGASTPNWMINRVHERLRSLKASDESLLAYNLGRILRFFFYSNILISLAALSLSYTAASLIGITSRFSQLIIAPLYIYSMTILNIFVDFNSIELNQPSRINFLLKYKKPLIITAVISVLSTLVIAASLAMEALLVVSLAVFLGLIYSLPILPEKIGKIFHLHRLRDIPGSKDMMVAAAWACTTVLIHPLSMEGLQITDLPLIFVFFWVFIVIFRQMIVGEVRYLQGDAIIGHSTLPVFMGKKSTYRVLNISYVLTILILLAGALTGYINALAYFLIIPTAYTFILNLVFKKKSVKNSLLFDLALYAELFFYGLISLVWVLSLM